MWHLLAAAGLGAAALTLSVSASVVFVDDNASLGGDGTSWGAAFVHLDEAITAAHPGDEVWVAAGTYRGGFIVDVPLSLYGGFAGWESDLAERDWVANETILSGDLDDDDGPGWTNRADNADRVIDLTTNDLVAIDGFAIEHGGTDSAYPGWGGGIRMPTGGDVIVRHCSVTENQAFLGGGLHAYQVSSVVVQDCVFANNRAEAGAGVYCFQLTEGTFERSTFTANEASGAGGGVSFVFGIGTFRDCVFSANVAGDLAGGLGVSAPNGCSVINCVFSRNEAWFHGSGLLLEFDHEIVNCTISENIGAEGLFIDHPSSVGSVTNTIVWGNDVTISVNPDAEIEIRNSCIEGGWPGSGNIDADPLFVQAGTDDVRLSFGSPCIDAGDDSAVPPDVTTDLAGAPRIQGAAVDMGAYEGAFEPLPQAAQADGLDQGDAAILVPSGGSPLDSAWVLVQNTSGDDNATFTVAEPEDLHAGAGGYAEASSVLSTSTTLEDGTHFTRVLIPFDVIEIGDAAPLEMNATYFAPSTGTWGLAVSRNTVNSPGHPRPIGDRIVTEGAGLPMATQELGDYGVHWNTSTGKGVVWANVDHASEFGAGAASCVEDCAQPPDERTGFRDLMAVLTSWGAGDGPFDVDGDGAVGANDLVSVIVAWGMCPP